MRTQRWPNSPAAVGRVTKPEDQLKRNVLPDPLATFFLVLG